MTITMHAAKLRIAHMKANANTCGTTSWLEEACEHFEMVWAYCADLESSYNDRGEIIQGLKERLAKVDETEADDAD